MLNFGDWEINFRPQLAYFTRDVRKISVRKVGAVAHGSNLLLSVRRIVNTLTAMAKWFRDFPINLKNGNERVRSASESGPQTRPKPSFSRDSLKGNQRKDAGMGGLLAGRNRKNSATELGRNNPSSGGTVWDSLTTGKGRKNSKVETGTSDENRQVRTSSLAQAYISRMIKVDKQDKTPKFNGISEQKQPENEKGRADIKATVSNF